MARENKEGARGLKYTSITDEEMIIVFENKSSVSGTYSVDFASCGIFNFSVSGDLQKLGEEFEDQITAFLGYFSSGYNRSSGIKKIGFILDGKDAPEYRYQGQKFPGHSKSNKYLFD